MTTAVLERAPTDQTYLSSADQAEVQINQCLVELKERFGDFSIGVVDRPMAVVNEGVGHQHQLAVDISGSAGGSFKDLSAQAGALMLPEGVEEVVVPSAGNYVNGAAVAAKKLGLKVVAFTPHSLKLNPVKYGRLESQGVDVIADFTDVDEAIEAAEASGKAWLHPYDNPYGIAGLTLLAEQALRVTVQSLELSGVDFEDLPVELLVQKGGGSLATAFALAKRRMQASGVFGDNFSLTTVRPELQNGELDQLYDGLKVKHIGNYAAAVLGNQSYVSGHFDAKRAGTADAARWVASKTPVSYEANALVGLGAAEELRRASDDPTVFVSYLTGRNADPGQRSELLNMPGLDQGLRYDVSNNHTSHALGGYTVQTMLRMRI